MNKEKVDKGLYGKYIIKKADGSDIDRNADYFVLRLDTDKYAREAILYYALLIRKDNPKLSEDLIHKYIDYAQAIIMSLFD